YRHGHLTFWQTAYTCAALGVLEFEIQNPCQARTVCLFKRTFSRISHHYFNNSTGNMSSLSSLQDSLTAPSECDMSRAVRTEDSDIDFTQRRHEKSGTSSVTPTVDRLGGSSKSTAEINDALHEYCSSFDQIRLLRRRLITANGGDSNLINLHKN
ncbi:hypothetical protein BJX76DRAFT_363900, partial [Aspergillus varians]